MKSLFISSLILLCLTLIISAKPGKVHCYKITYNQFSNDTTKESKSFDILYYEGVCFLSNEKSTVSSYIDFNRSLNINIIKNENNSYRTSSTFKENPTPVEIGEDYEKIEGYKCRKATYNSFSNKIEVWFTTKSEAKGSPYQHFLPIANSLVVKIVINGNRTILISKVEKIMDFDLPEYKYEESVEISDAEFEELKILSRYTVIPIFANERINFNPEIEKNDYTKMIPDTSYNLSKGGIILKRIKLPELAKEGAYCYAKLTVKSDGDAYDRTGSVFIIPASANKTFFTSLFEGPEILPTIEDKNGVKYQGFVLTEDYEPPVEIMRFFTSFGAGYFNTKREINNYNWANEIVYKQEVTKLIPTDEDEICVGVFIGNYDKGGHIVSLELDFYPLFDEYEQENRFVLPLFNTVNVMEMTGQNYSKFFNTDTLRLDFDFPEGISNQELLFTTTGHGGWGEGDEFVPKLNQIFIDGEKVFEIVPWRTDCATYRFNNPASGNFENGLSSSDLSRSNWCPGTLTPPYIVKLPNLKAGKHTIEVVIDQGEDVGSSFSAWSVSGVIVGNLE